MKNSKTIRNQIVVASPVGKLRLIASDKGLVAIDVRNVRVASNLETSASAQKILSATKKQLEQYFAGKRTNFDIPLDLEGTDFQQQAWRALCRIPYGKTISYGQQAKNIKKPKHFVPLVRPMARTPSP